jgi:hypothetical protein
MDARWIHKRMRGIEPTMRLELRAGTQGHGRVLGAAEYWTMSNKSMDEADRLCQRIEDDARADGYTILPDAETF